MSSYLLPQLPYLAPILLAYLVGGLVGLLFLRRHPTPAVLVLAGCGLLFVVTTGFTVLQAYLIASQAEQGLAFEDIRQRLLVLGVARSLLYITGFALLLAAAFVGRRAGGTPR